MDNVYIISSADCKIKDILECSDYAITENLNFSGKSTISVARKPEYSEEDFIYLNTGTDVFKGIIELVESADDSISHTITCKQIECMFDTTIELEGESLISGNGIEDFLKKAIEDNFTDSGDTFGDKTYITVTASTHNTFSTKPDVQNGVYNLKTFLGNAKEYYGIFCDFSFENEALTINISKKTQNQLSIDTKVTDITNLDEKYQISVLSKLKLIWYNTSSLKKTYKYFYLKTDRTITTSSADTDRAAGAYKTIYVEAETEQEANQEAYNQFASNSYNHSITCDINSKSMVYEKSELYIGHKCSIKTEKHGIKDTIISEITRTKNSIMNIKFGNLKITLIEKLRG